MESTARKHPTPEIAIHSSAEYRYIESREANVHLVAMDVPSIHGM